MVGVGKVGAVELGGIYDDAGGAPNAAFAGLIGSQTPATASKALVITWGGTKTTTLNAQLVSYTRSDLGVAMLKGWTKVS